MSVPVSRQTAAWTAAALALAVALGFPAPMEAGWKADIGFTKLQALLGVNLPNGAGVPVSQVEAAEGAALNYLPQAGSGTYGGVGIFAGKTFTAVSGSPTGVSGHAQTVGNWFFGLTTSLAPGVTLIDCYGANDFTSRLGTGGTRPFDELNRIQSHAWISTTSSGSNDDLRRLDFAIDRDGYLAVVGVNNGGANPVPYLLSPGFNSISVGLSDLDPNGNPKHSYGAIPSGLDGQGRIEPELVSPSGTTDPTQQYTSWATGIVSSAGAMLHEALLGVSPVPEADQSMVLKALLLAGATKDEVTAWNRLQSRPIDDRFGAGRMNVYHSYQMIAAGEQNPGAVAPYGWDRESIGTSQIKSYTFTVPEGGFADRFSVFLTWNRHLEFVRIRFSRRIEPLPLANLDLVLKDSSGTVLDQSTSTIYNLEHLFARNLPPDTYTLEVTSDRSETYVLAWRLTEGRGPGIDIVADQEAGTTTLHFTNLDPLATYTVRSSTTDLAPGSFADEAGSSFSPSGTTGSWEDPAGIPGARKFYQLDWNIPSAPP